MRLQDVLHERELEISLLEESLRVKEQSPLIVNGRPKLNGADSFVSAQEELPEDDGRSTPVIMTPTHARTLSPKTMDQFDAIRQTMNSVHVPNGASDSDDSLRRLNELMRLVCSVCSLNSTQCFPAIVQWLRRNPVIAKRWTASMSS